MEINSKRMHTHHLHGLSGSSQAPLIPPNEFSISTIATVAADNNNDGSNNNGSQHSTPNSVHSLPFSSPNRPSHQLGPPSMPNSAASVNSQASFFFPLIPARSSQHHQHNNNNRHHLNHHHQQHQQHQFTGNGRQQKPQFSLDFSNKSPKSVADLNMNAQQERNREISHAKATTTSISPNQSQFSPANSSKLNSPLNMPAKSFPGFFPELIHQPIQPTRRSIQPLNTSMGSANDNSTNWNPQQEDIYHLYHEPIDTDELRANVAHPIKALQENLSAQKKKPSPDQLKICPPPPSPRSASTNKSLIVTKDWNFAVPNTLSDKSPTNGNISGLMNSELNNNSTSIKPVPTSFAERTGSGNRCDDVSANIYSAYVSLKSSDRSNHRSRSYHGPKNTTLQNEARLAAFGKDSQKNLSATSVAHLPISPSLTTMMPGHHFRNHCVRELIETESNYVLALDMMISCFAKPLESFLKKDENQLIFGHIKYFHSIHSTFLSDLEKAALGSCGRDLVNFSSPSNNSSMAIPSPNHTSSNPSTPTSVSNIPQLLKTSPSSSLTVQDFPTIPANKSASMATLKISSCFMNAKEKFLKYGEYCASISKAQALLDELTNKNEAIAAKLDRCQQDANEGKFKLRDLLSLPMQRILKYHLLLAQLIKNTSSTNDDYDGLKRAHETMRDIGIYINEVKRDTEDVQIIHDIEQCIAGLKSAMPEKTQLTDYGRLVTDGLIRIEVPHELRPKPPHGTKLKLTHDTKLKQKRYVFVFDKVMLICKVIGDRRFQYKEALLLSQYEIDANPTSMLSEVSKHVTKDKWCFGFNLVQTFDKTTYSFYTKTLEMKKKWIDLIQRAMDNVRPPACRNNETNHEFLMHTFDKASSCGNCGKLLPGLYYQGYRCKNCFVYAHKRCLAAIEPCGLQKPRARCNEPPSPSMRSNCSDDSHNIFVHFPPSNALSTQCVNSIAKNEYSNIDSRADAMINPSSSFRESVTRSTITNQRTVSSMINVSLQNSANHLMQQGRLFNGSSSTPSINHQANLRAKAVSDYDGSEDSGHLMIKTGDPIIIYKSSIRQAQSTIDDVDKSIGRLKIETCGKPSTNGSSFWFGKNMRTFKEGQFPPSVVEVLSDQNRIQVGVDHQVNESKYELGNSHVNFVLGEYPWFCGRMERDRAQDMLENKPQGTFLVRVSPKHNNSYVISLKYNTQVKHMRIYVSQDNQLYLSQNRYFKSVIELVSWYEKNSLVESFHMLDAKLSIPFKSN